jgi:hypothetical protein
MNTLLHLLAILLILAISISSTPIRRQDLSNFKPCQGDFPNKITLYEFNPNPIVAGQVVTVHMGGKATVPIEKGALFQNTVFYNNEQAWQHNDDFCEEIVTPGGFTCPVEGDFNFINQFPTDTDPNVKNTVLNFFVRMLSKFL